MRAERAAGGVARLHALVVAERSALLAGDLDGLTRLVAEKEALIEEGLTPGEVPDTMLDALRTAIARNQALLDGAREGLYRARDRVAAQQQAQDTLQTYDPDGRQRTIRGQARHRVERRA